MPVKTRKGTQLDADCNWIWRKSQSCYCHVFDIITAAQWLERVYSGSTSKHPAYRRAQRACNRLVEEKRLEVERFYGTNQSVFWNPDRVKPLIRD